MSENVFIILCPRDRAPNEEIVILVSSLRRVAQMGVGFVYTDQHAYLGMAEYFTSLDDLHRIDWPILQNQDYKRDNSDLGKTDRYQAEALVWKHLPVEGILGICCFTDQVRDRLKLRAGSLGLPVKIFKTSDWFFR